MKSYSNLFRHIILFVAVINIAALYCQRVVGQDDDFKVTISTTDVSSKSGQDGSIQIQVDKADSQYQYMLFNGEPWDGGKLLEKKESMEQTLIFSSLKPGNYYLCVRNSSDVTRCQNIIIK
jgi:hypothetical protein